MVVRDARGSFKIRPVDMERKLNVHKTSRTSSRRLMYVQFTSCVHGVDNCYGYVAVCDCCRFEYLEGAKRIQRYVSKDVDF